MLTLCGSPFSNYYNKVKMALLEKNITFTEELVGLRVTDPQVRQATPLGKIPFIRTDAGSLCESQVILDYLETAYPEHPLLPSDAFAAAKVRELVTFIDWHLEITARQLYGAAFFGAPPLSEGNATRIRQQLNDHIAALKTLLKFSPFAAGDTFTLADCSAYCNLPVVAMACKAVFGEDLLMSAGIDQQAYTSLIGQRASAQKVVADRKIEVARMAAAKAAQP